MRTSKPDHYAVLGVAASAEGAEIKRRYRELARKYHPDVNPGNDASARIKAINEAYRILGDEELRAIYDADRALKERTPSEIPLSARPAASRRPNRSQSTGPRSGSGAARTAPAGPAPSIQQMIDEARLAIINRRFARAEAICLRALQLNSRSSVVHELLGDIYMRQGATDRACAAYSYAVQFDPQRVTAQTKLSRLSTSERKWNSGVTMSSSHLRDGIASNSPEQVTQRAIMALTIVLGVCFGLTLVWGPVHIGAIDAIQFPFVTSFPLGFTLLLLADGIISGFLLGIYGGMRPLSDHLRKSYQRAGMPIGLCTTLIAVVSFYISLLVFLWLVMARDARPLSLARIYGLVMILVVVFMLFQVSGSDPSAIWLVAGFSGNILFPAAMAGWLASDLVRLRNP